MNYYSMAILLTGDCIHHKVRAIFTLVYILNKNKLKQTLMYIHTLSTRNLEQYEPKYIYSLTMIIIKITEKIH